MAPYVKEMVDHFSANLTLVHAYGMDALARTELEITRPELPEKAHVLEEQRLQDFALATFPSRHVESIAEFGEPGRIIHEVVNRQGTDLVMMPTHGRGPVRRLLLGSVAAKVLHDVSAAVWTGTGSIFEGNTPKVPHQSILCAVDDTDEAKGVLKAAAALACSYKAKLWIVHVMDISSARPEISFGPYLKDLMNAADFKLRELKGELGLDAPHAVIDAFVTDGIREEAVRRNADLIVTGRGQAQATFRMWSRLYPIIRRSPCPVLSI